MSSLQNLYFIFSLSDTTGLEVKGRFIPHGLRHCFPKYIIFQPWITTVLFQDLNETRKPKKILKLCIKPDTSKLLKNL